MAKYTLGDLTGPEGNAFAIIAKVTEAMRKENKTVEERDSYTAEAMKGNYTQLVEVSKKMIEKLNTKTK